MANQARDNLVDHHHHDCSHHHVFSFDLHLQEGSPPIGTDDDQSSLRAQLERRNRFAPSAYHDFLFAASFHCHAVSFSSHKQQIGDICKQETVAMLDSSLATTLRRKRRTRRRISSPILSPRRVRTSQSELKHCKICINLIKYTSPA